MGSEQQMKQCSSRLVSMSTSEAVAVHVNRITRGQRCVVEPTESNPRDNAFEDILAFANRD